MRYVIWSVEQQAWRLDVPSETGYCLTLADAARFDHDRAAELIHNAHYREVMIPVAALAGASQEPTP